MEEYVKSLENSTDLIDKLSKVSYDFGGDKGKPIYPCHLTPAELHDAIKNGRLQQGTFLASRENFMEGTVNVDGMEKAVSSLKFISTTCIIICLLIM